MASISTCAGSEHDGSHLERPGAASREPTASPRQRQHQQQQQQQAPCPRRLPVPTQRNSQGSCSISGGSSHLPPPPQRRVSGSNAVPKSVLASPQSASRAVRGEGSVVAAAASPQTSARRLKGDASPQVGTRAPLQAHRIPTPCRAPRINTRRLSATPPPNISPTQASCQEGASVSSAAGSASVPVPCANSSPRGVGLNLPSGSDQDIDQLPPRARTSLEGSGGRASPSLGHRRIGLRRASDSNVRPPRPLQMGAASASVSQTSPQLGVRCLPGDFISCPPSLRTLEVERSLQKRRLSAEDRAATFHSAVLGRLEEIRRASQVLF